MTRRSVRDIVLASSWVAAAALSGCGGHSASLPPEAGSTRPMAAATFVMHWPGVQIAGRSAGRHFISKSTKSVVIEVNGDASLTTMMNNPSTNSQGAVTNITIQAPAGNDMITFSLYDQPQQSGETAAAGNELGQVTVTQAIAAGKQNTVNAIVDGIVASIDLTPLPNQSTVTANASGGYTIAGDMPVTFTATPKDVDGNVIVDNGTPIAYSASSLNPAIKVTPVSGHADRFAVQTVAAPQTNAHVGITVQAVSGASSLAQSNVAIALASLTYVGYTNSGSGAITAFSQSGTPIVLAGSFPGVTAPIAMASDPGAHHLYVLDGTTETIREFNTDGTAASGYANPVVAGANGISFDDHNSVLYVSTPSTVVGFNADGSAATLGGSFANISGAVGVYAYEDIANGIYKVFVANAGNNTVSWYQEDGTPGPPSPGFPRLSFTTNTFVPSAITGDPQTASLQLIGSDAGTASAASFNIFGAAQGQTSTALASPNGIGFNPLDANAYVANAATGAVTVYDEYFSGLITTIPAPSGLSNPASFAFVF